MVEVGRTDTRNRFFPVFSVSLRPVHQGQWALSPIIITARFEYGSQMARLAWSPTASPRLVGLSIFSHLTMLAIPPLPLKYIRYRRTGKTCPSQTLNPSPAWPSYKMLWLFYQAVKRSTSVIKPLLLTGTHTQTPSTAITTLLWARLYNIIHIANSVWMPASLSVLIHFFKPSGVTPPYVFHIRWRREVLFRTTVTVLAGRWLDVEAERAPPQIDPNARTHAEFIFSLAHRLGMLSHSVPEKKMW